MLQSHFPFVASNNLSDDSTTQQEETEKPKKRKKKKPSPKTSDTTSLRDQLADSHSSLRDYFPDPALRNYLQGLYVSKLHQTFLTYHISSYLHTVEKQNRFLESLFHLPL